MKELRREIPIFFTIDDNYAPFLAVALRSLVRHASYKRTYRAIVLHQGLNEENIIKLKSLETDNVKIELLPMRENFLKLEDRIENRLRCDYFTLTIYFRLFIPEMFVEYDKGIYIDSDVVLTTDISKLYDIDLGDNYIGACPDYSISTTPEIVDYTIRAVGVKKGEYINSGVLLMNLKKMRDEGFEKHFLDLLNTYHFDSIAPDQDYLNAICNGKILYLDQRWNSMPNYDLEPFSDTFLVHYNLFKKPWCYSGVQYEDVFWLNALECPYYNKLLDLRESYTDEKKQNDEKCFRMLMDRGQEIIDKDITFSKLHESGVRIRL